MDYFVYYACLSFLVIVPIVVTVILDREKKRTDSNTNSQSESQSGTNPSSNANAPSDMDDTPVPMTRRQLMSYSPTEEFSLELIYRSISFGAFTDVQKIDVVLYSLILSNMVFFNSISFSNLDENAKDRMIQNIIDSSVNAFNRYVASNHPLCSTTWVSFVFMSRTKAYTDLIENSERALLYRNLRRALCWCLKNGWSNSNDGVECSRPIPFDKFDLYDAHITERLEEMSHLLSSIDVSIIQYTATSNSSFFLSLDQYK